MAVDDLPLPVLPTVHVRDPESVRTDRATVNGHLTALVADRVGQIAADARGNEVEGIRVPLENRDATQRKVSLTSSQPLLATPTRRGGSPDLSLTTFPFAVSGRRCESLLSAST